MKRGDLSIRAGAHWSSPDIETRPNDREYILQTVGLTKTFAGFTAVNKVNLNVRRGTIHALIGPNGAGKTTCFNLITKILPASGGKILYRGRDISRATPHAVARLGLVRLFQISAVFPHLSVLENVRVALQRKLGTSYHIWRPASSVEVLNNRALELLSPGFSPMPRCPRSNYPMAASAL